MEPASANPPTEKPKVTLIDSNRQLMDWYADVLRQRGLDVQLIGPDDVKGWLEAAGRPPNVVVTEITMICSSPQTSPWLGLSGDMSATERLSQWNVLGVALAAEIRKRFRDVPIVVLTSLLGRIPGLPTEIPVFRKFWTLPSAFADALCEGINEPVTEFVSGMHARSQLYGTEHVGRLVASGT
jgi:hypothetical protein